MATGKKTLQLLPPSAFHFEAWQEQQLPNSPHPHPLNQAPPHRVHCFLSGEVLVRSRLDGADLVGGVDASGGGRGGVEIAGAPCVVGVHLAGGEGGDGGGVQHGVHVCRQRVRCVLHVPGALVGRRRGHRRGKGAVLAHAGRSGSGQCCHLVLLVGGDEVVVVDRGAVECGCGPVTVVTARTQDTPLNHPLDTDTLLTSLPDKTIVQDMTPFQTTKRTHGTTEQTLTHC